MCVPCRAVLGWAGLGWAGLGRAGLCCAVLFMSQHMLSAEKCTEPLALMPSGGLQDMFGGLSLEAPAAGPSQTGLDALMGLGSPQAPLQSPSAGVGADLFGGLSVGGKQLQATLNCVSAAACAHRHL